MRSSLWLLSPVALLYGLFGLVPFGMILRFSLADGGEHYRTVLESRLLLRIAINTVTISAITTAVALVLAVLLAAALWRTTGAIRAVLMGFVLLPFWTAVLIKNFAWAALLQDNGVVNALLQALGLTNGPVTLLHNRLAVVIGMVHFVPALRRIPHLQRHAGDRPPHRARRAQPGRVTLVGHKACHPAADPPRLV